MTRWGLTQRARRGLRAAQAALACAAALLAPLAPSAQAQAASRATPLEVDAEAWRRPERWQALRRGMDYFDVIVTLGRPGRIVRYDGFERWEYPDFRGGRVHFDAEQRLVSWRAPGPTAAKFELD